jgi:hypothetical protein
VVFLKDFFLGLQWLRGVCDFSYMFSVTKVGGPAAQIPQNGTKRGSSTRVVLQVGTVFGNVETVVIDSSTGGGVEEEEEVGGGGGGGGGGGERGCG